MLVKISNLKMPIDAPLPEVFKEAARLLPISPDKISEFKLLRRSIDARRGAVNFVYTVLAETVCDFSLPEKNVTLVTKTNKEAIKEGEKKLNHRPVIVGFGPCGMFCALTLARRGFNPIVIERGSDVDARTNKINEFWKTGVLDENTNVQFGEGGAGTFSDGKLTTRIGDSLIDSILKEFVLHGAPEDILYNAMPHVGTDVLKSVVKNIREEILSLGGKILFNSKVTDITFKDEKIKSVKLEDGSDIPCDVLVFAIGHSARDTYEMLYLKGISMIVKPFSVGFRVEHLKDDIDRAMYGKYAGDARLGAAPYKLSNRDSERACYSFCMCPGGLVVNASSENGRLVTNGMSKRARDEVNSNSAICISVGERDFGSFHPLSAIEFQRTLEEKAYRMGGSNFSAPVQRLGDFIDGVKSNHLGAVKPTFLPGTQFSDLNDLLPSALCSFMKKSFSVFDKKIKGFGSLDAILTGVETRTSAPVRIVRNENLESVSIGGLYPAGEGAGYAGGIMSASVDGIHIANKIIENFSPAND